MRATDALLPQIVQRITGTANAEFDARPLTGGCINQTHELSLRDRAYFVKLNRADRLDMFQAEARGLEALAATGSFRIPAVICLGELEDQAYLVLEYIRLTNSGDQALAGRQLASQHRALGRHFGWDRDNYIGTTPQPNPSCDSWIDFWREQRLGFQLTLAASQGHRGKLQLRGQRLMEKLPGLLDHAPQPSLLHGDLWSGNLGYDGNAGPVTFDPAVYFGDRETDLAMSELFGGFSDRFYSAYNEAWPLDVGYDTRKSLYNLYHILNHLNLFGGGYGRQALVMIDRLLAELGD